MAFPLPPFAFPPSVAQRVLEAPTPLAASAELCAALSLPLDAGRLSLSCDTRAVLVVELLLSALQEGRAAGMGAGAIAAALTALHGAVGDCLAGAGGWLPLSAAVDSWASRLARASPSPDLSREHSARFDAWLKGTSFLLPHHYAMYGTALRAPPPAPSADNEGGGGGAVYRVKPIVEVPFDVPPLDGALLLPAA